MSEVINSLRQVGANVLNDDYEELQRVNDGRVIHDNIARLVANHSLTLKEAARACGQSIPTFKKTVNKAIAESVIPEVILTNKRYVFTLDHMHALMDWLKLPRWSDKNPNCHVINCENQKGGTGKSILALSIAAASALPLQDRMRVLLIDLDPQGSLRNSTVPELEFTGDEFLTAVDIMLGEEEQDSLYLELKNDGHSHKEIVEMAIQPTHIPNLSILPSVSEDERFSAVAWNSLRSNDEIEHIAYLKDKIIDVIKDDYDLIIIDTGPHVNPLVWSAQEASNGMIIPFSPRQLDVKSTAKFMYNLGEQMENNLPSKGLNLKWWRALVTNYDDEYNRDTVILNRVKSSIGRNMFNSIIKKSSGFEAANQNFCTIFDLIKSEKLCSASQLEKGQQSVKEFRREFIFHLQDVDLNNER